MNAGGRPASVAAFAGATSTGNDVGSLASTPGRYHVRNASMTSRVRIGASAFSMKEGADWSPTADGYHSSWNTSGGPPASRARRVITADRLPPAESPAT